MASWAIKSIDSGGRTCDTMVNQLSQSQITTIVNNLKSHGVTHIAMDCPMDAPADYPNPKPVAGYDVMWINAIRNAGLNINFRGQWINFNSWYTAQKLTPASTPSRATGIAANVLNGTDTDSYLYRTWNYIKTHPTYFAKRDIWAVLSEPEVQGVGADLSINMFPDYATIGQWLVDMKTVADDAFENTLGYSLGDIITGHSSVLGGTMLNASIDSSYFTQLGKCVIDHYGTSNIISSDFDTMYANAGNVDIYVGEYGTVEIAGGSLDDSLRSDLINKVFAIFKSKAYIKGLNYWECVDYEPLGGYSGILNYYNYSTRHSGGIIQKFFQNTSRIFIG